MKQEKTEKQRLLLTYLLIGLAGIPFFLTGYFWDITLFLVTFFMFHSRKHSYSNGFLTFITIYAILIIAQVIAFSYVNITSVIGRFLTIFTAYYFMKLIGTEFPKYYVVIMKYIAITSIIIFGIFILFPQVEGFFRFNVAPVFDRGGNRGYTYVSNMIVYTFNTGINSDTERVLGFGPDVRNPGPFVEAGVFGVFLLIAFIFSSILSRSVLNKTNYIFILAIITTFSTSTYIIFSFLFIVLIYYVEKRNESKKYFILPFALFIFLQLYINIDFLGDKVRSRFNQVNTSVEMYDRKERFGSFVYNFQEAAESPFVGKSIFDYSRYGGLKYGYGAQSHQNNGLSDMFATYGFIFPLYFFFLLYVSLKSLFSLHTFFIGNRLKYFSFVIFVSFLLMGFSQVIFHNVFFISMTFFGFILPENRINNRANKSRTVNYNLT